ncbi:hypothetical protein Tco_0195343 [Tanacetum coccineum]
MGGRWGGGGLRGAGRVEGGGCCGEAGKCRSPGCWAEVGEAHLQTEIIPRLREKFFMIRDRMQAARDRQSAMWTRGVAP